MKKEDRHSLEIKNTFIFFSRFLGRVGAGRVQISMRGQIRVKTYDFFSFSGPFHMIFSDTCQSAWSSIKTFLENDPLFNFIFSSYMH